MKNSPITVRVPADLLEWLDGEVARGRHETRSVAITRLIRKAKRAQDIEHDLLIMMANPPTADERSLQEWANTHQAWPTDEPARPATPVATTRPAARPLRWIPRRRYWRSSRRRPRPSR